jgi:hypothetical protein
MSSSPTHFPFPPPPLFLPKSQIRKHFPPRAAPPYTRRMSASMPSPVGSPQSSSATGARPASPSLIRVLLDRVLSALLVREAQAGARAPYSEANKVVLHRHYYD